MKRRISLLLALVMLIFNGFGTTVSWAYSNDSYTWKSAVITGGGFVPGVIYSQAQNGLLYARTDVGGAYRWNSTSRTWIPLSDFLGKDNIDDMGILSLAADPTDANRVYMMTGLYTKEWATHGNFYASSDKGATWTKTALPFKVGGNEDGRNAGERLQVDPNLPSTIYMGTTRDGLYKSTDYGDSWSKVTSFPAKNINFVCIDESSSSTGTATKRIIVGTNSTSNGMYISNDGGTTWTLMSGQPSNYCPIRCDINSGTLYIAYSGFKTADIAQMPGPGGASSGVLYKCNISNNTWTNITPSGQGTYFGFGGISVDKQNPNNIVASTLDRWWMGDEIFRSTDGGSTWTEILKTGTRDDSKATWEKQSNIGWIADIKIDQYNSDNAIFTTGGGVYMTTNLSSPKVIWSFDDSGLEETCALELKSPPTGANLLSVIGDGSGFKHDDLTKSPVNGHFTPGNGTNRGIDFAELSPSKVVRTQDNKSTSAYGSYSTDGGDTWTEFAAFPSNAGAGAGIAISADGSSIVLEPLNTSYNATMIPFVSKNNGDTWTQCTGIAAGVKPISDRVNSNKFYAFDYQTGKVYVSNDGGVSFTVESSNLPTQPSWLENDTELRTVFGKEGHLWITCGNNGLYHSTNSGTSFTKLSNITEAYKIGFGKAAAAGGYPAIYIVGKVNGTYGFFRSNDQGATWARLNDDAHQFGNIGVITGDPKVYGRVYLAAGGRGIIYGDLSGGNPIKIGDVNNDGQIDMLDYIELQQHIINESIDINTQNSDLNEDSKINAVDLLALRKIILYN